MMKRIEYGVLVCMADGHVFQDSTHLTLDAALEEASYAVPVWAIVPATPGANR